jgi:hypothetical protein
VILWEWVDARGKKGALSGVNLDHTAQAKLDERLDRIRQLKSLNDPDSRIYVFPFHHRFKKVKIRGRIALRPILIIGPYNSAHEATFLFMMREENNRPIPSKPQVVRISMEREGDILLDPQRRQRYD